jgi:acetyl-CoA carboxylase biotin carboxyl carrier protein
MTGERRSKDKEKLAIDPDIVRELARLLDETGLSEIEFERDGQRVRVARQAQPSAPAPARLAVVADPPLAESTPLGPSSKSAARSRPATRCSSSKP